MIEALLTLPIIVMAAVIAYCDYKTQLIPLPLLALFPIVSVPLTLLSWQYLLVLLPGSATTITIAALFVGAIVAGAATRINGVPILDIGGADILVLITLAAALPHRIIELAIIALILGCIISTAYLLRKNKPYQGPLLQRCTMLATETTHNGKPAFRWQRWDMPLCVPIAASLTVIMILGQI